MRLWLPQLLILVLERLSFALGQEGSLLCRMCGHDILRGQHLNRIVSKLAQERWNQTILGRPEVTVQLFKNPQNEEFDVITASEADVTKSGQAYGKDSWFPGYAWTVTSCPVCGHHMGWEFSASLINAATGEKRREAFQALVLNYLHSADFSDSLTKIPRIGHRSTA